MKLYDALAIVERLSPDVIGMVFAGAMFLVLLCFHFNLPADSDCWREPSSVLLFTAMSMRMPKTLNKAVTFVEEADHSKRLGMLRETADYHPVGLEAGMTILQSPLEQELIK